MPRRRTVLYGALCGSLLTPLVLTATIATAGIAPVSDGRAIQYAANILNALHLPADAQVSASEPSGEGTSEESAVLSSCVRRYTGSVDVRRFWTSAEAPEAVIATIESHLPTNAIKATRQPSASACGLALPSPGHGLGPAELGIVTSQTKPGHTIVRADVIVTKPPRTPWLPKSARTVIVTVTPAMTGSLHPRPTFGPKAITARNQVQQILQAVEQLRHPITSPNQLYMCPPAVHGKGHTVKLAFARGLDSHTVARLMIAPSCGSAAIQLSILGRHSAQSLTSVPRQLGARPLLRTLEKILKTELPGA